ncbi:MAG: twin-arginine translocase TatA/TatE family subunit [Actinomycetota bacterium]
MGNLGGGEILVILFVALIVLGPNKLPEAARQVGRAVNEVRRISGGFQREMREAMNEPIRAAEEAKNQIMDPFGQASSSAGTGAAGVPKTGSADTDPPLPTATPKADDAASTDPAPAAEAADESSPTDGTDANGSADDR